MIEQSSIDQIDGLIAGLDAAEHSEYLAHLREIYPEQLGPAAVTGTSEGPDRILTEAVTLTPEQQEKAAKVTAALAEKFCVAVEDFSVLRSVGEDGIEHPAVVYAAGSGIDLGDPLEMYDPARSYNSIFADGVEEQFIIEVDGHTYDSRRGMTKATYRAFIEDAQAREVDPLPDKGNISNANGRHGIATLLTGEEVTIDPSRFIPVQARVGHIYGGRASGIWTYPDSGFWSQLFRPAVVIE